MHLLETGFYKRARQDQERGPIDPLYDGGRQMTFEKRGGVLGLGEDSLEKSVVGVRGRGERCVIIFHGARLDECFSNQLRIV